MSKFKVGDRVLVTHPGIRGGDKEATLLHSGFNCWVKFDDGYQTNVTLDWLEPVEPAPIEVEITKSQVGSYTIREIEITPDELVWGRVIEPAPTPKQPSDARICEVYAELQRGEVHHGLGLYSVDGVCFTREEMQAAWSRELKRRVSAKPAAVLACEGTLPEDY